MACDTLFLASNGDRTGWLADPDAMTEEILRHTPPLHMFTRYVLEDCELFGVPFKQGDVVGLHLGLANHDPRAMPEPQRFDPSREPVKQVAFGAGIHFCIGHTLARLEMATAIPMLFQRFPNIRMAETPSFKNAYHFHGLERLKVIARMSRQLVFDGHNDLLARLYLAGGVKAACQFQAGRPSGHLDAHKARIGGFGGGFFAIWVPSTQRGTPQRRDANEAMRAFHYDIPLSPMVPADYALSAAHIQMETLQALQDQGSLTICTTADHIEHVMEAGDIAAFAHMEGAEAIDPDFAVLDEFHALGLRSLGPVWSRPTIYGEGVPFRFPGSPDIGGGLTDHGKRLVAKCNALKMMIDLAHLNEAGFWDVARLSDAPLVATHSNAHTLCPHARNLTDKQLGRHRRIRRRRWPQLCRRIPAR
jgi:microsomal dipeptidase-like Zn-dependent dipeptidase